MNDLPANMSMGQTPPPQPNLTAANPQQVSQQVEQKAQEWLKQHQDVPSLLSRKRLSLTLGGVAVILVVVVPLTVWLVSRQQQLAEVRSRARETAELSQAEDVVIENQKIMPDMYRYLSQKYLPQDTTSPIDLTVKVVKISESNNKISGVAYFKYDSEEELAYVFSRITGLTSENETVPHLWIQRGSEYRLLGDSEYILLGEMALTHEPEGTVGYFTAYYDDPTIMAFDFLVVSYDSAGELKTPQSIVAKVNTTLTDE
ncbi:MAG: hypothetical protein HY381_00785 [Candidatus Chisholmbacteria bacterium]|nr:hypothetical protein [Candidatus Chisholmbacteria bacterium]